MFCAIDAQFLRQQIITNSKNMSPAKYFLYKLGTLSRNVAPCNILWQTNIQIKCYITISAACNHAELCVTGPYYRTSSFEIARHVTFCLSFQTIKRLHTVQPLSLNVVTMWLLKCFNDFVKCNCSRLCGYFKICIGGYGRSNSKVNILSFDFLIHFKNYNSILDVIK